MSESIKQNVDTGSAKFQEGVEAGLNSQEDTKNWVAGKELGEELRSEGENKELKESSTPLFMRDGPGGNKGEAQDEKDETEE
jgi:hypothetical protein